MSDAGAAAEAPEHTLASPQDLLTMLACPEDWGFLPCVWVALSAPEELVSRRPEHTLAGRLQMKSNVLKRLASDAGLWGKARTYHLHVSLHLLQAHTCHLLPTEGSS